MSEKKPARLFRFVSSSKFDWFLWGTAAGMALAIAMGALHVGR